MIKITKRITKFLAIVSFLGASLPSLAFSNDQINRASAGGVGSGGLGRAFPLYYSTVRTSAQLPNNFRWEDVTGEHLRIWQETSRQQGMPRFHQQTLVEVIFRSVADFSGRLSGSDKDQVVRWWGSFMEQVLRERMPDSEKCARGIRESNREFIESSCGLPLLEVSLAPGGSWLARLGIDIRGPAALVQGKNFLEMDTALTRNLLHRAGSALSNHPPADYPLDVAFVANLVFERLLRGPDNIAESDRMEMIRGWTFLAA